MGALNDIRVIDLSGPLAEMTGRVLADLGAEVIKIEPPGGCESRRVPPFADETGDSLYWRAFGLGKHSVALDLDDSGDRAAFDDLVRHADIVIVSDPPSMLEARRLGPDHIEALNPSALYVSVTPYGRTGPEAESPATDLTLAAAGGFLNCQGDRDRPPVPIGVPETSHSAAVQAAADAVCALIERDRSGRGQVLDASMQAASVGTLLFIAGFAVQGVDAPGMGEDRAHPANPLGLTIPVFCRTADGFLGMTLVLGKPGARSLGRMMAWAGAEDGLDADLAVHDWTDMFGLMRTGTITVADAQRGLDQLVAFFGTRTKREIHDRGVEGRWLVAPALTAADLLADPHLAARDFWVDVAGTTHMGPFAKLTATPIEYRRPAPALGADQVLVCRPRPRPAARPADSDARRPVFDGLKVADFSWVGAGPLVSRELANLGATVVRIESENHIDPLRIIPPWKDGVPDHRTGHCMANFNQSKLGLGLDLTVPQSREIIDRLLEWADVVIESFVPGTAARFGLDAATVQARRPDIVMLSSCMRGQTGPESGYTGFGLQGAALAGFVAVTGWADRLPAGPFAAYSDFLAPRFSLAALAAAIRHRNHTGEGQYIDLSQVEAAMHVLEPMVLDAAVNGRAAGLRGTDSDRACPNGVYRTAGVERYVAISVETAAQWHALRSSVPALAGFDDAGLDDLAGRIGQRDRLDAALQDAVVDDEPFALARRLRQAGVPAAVVARATDLIADPQLVDRHHFVELDHPYIGTQRYEGPVTHLSATPHRPTHAGPAIGQHTVEVLTHVLGCTDDEMTELAAAGALT